MQAAYTVGMFGSLCGPHSTDLHSSHLNFVCLFLPWQEISLPAADAKTQTLMLLLSLREREVCLKSKREREMTKWDIFIFHSRSNMLQSQTYQKYVTVKTLVDLLFEVSLCLCELLYFLYLEAKEQPRFSVFGKHIYDCLQPLCTVCAELKRQMLFKRRRRAVCCVSRWTSKRLYL